MTLEQTIGVCFGSNIGTTFTAWILCLGDIKDTGGGGFISFILKMLKPESFSPLVALAGIILIMFAKKNKKKDIGRILVGFAILMTGMTLMSDSVDPLANSPEFPENAHSIQESGSRSTCRSSLYRYYSKFCRFYRNPHGIFKVRSSHLWNGAPDNHGM